MYMYIAYRDTYHIVSSVSWYVSYRDVPVSCHPYCFGEVVYEEETQKYEQFSPYGRQMTTGDLQTDDGVVITHSSILPML